MKTSKQWLGFLLIGVAAVALGVTMLFFTDDFARVLVFGIGIFVFVNGAGALFLAAGKKFDERTRTMLLVRGVLGIVAGLVAVLLPLAVAKVGWYFMLYVLAAERAVNGMLLVLSLSGLKRQGRQITRSAVNAGVSLVLALSIFIMPQESGRILLSVIAAALIIYGITIFLLGINRMKPKKPIEKPIEKTVEKPVGTSAEKSAEKN